MGKVSKKPILFFESNLIDETDIGTTKSLQQIHSYILVDYTILPDRSDKKYFERWFSICCSTLFR